MNLRHISLSILLSVAIFVIITLPHLSLLIFNVGIEYSNISLLICAIFSGLAAPHLAKHKLFN
jgi:hypothetical protein